MNIYRLEAKFSKLKNLKDCVGYSVFRAAVLLSKYYDYFNSISGFKSMPMTCTIVVDCGGRFGIICHQNSKYYLLTGGTG